MFECDLECHGYLPTVPLPPIFKMPNLKNGTDNVRISGVTFRITMTLSGCGGTSLEVILYFLVSLFSVHRSVTCSCNVWIDESF